MLLTHTTKMATADRLDHLRQSPLFLTACDHLAFLLSLQINLFFENLQPQQFTDPPHLQNSKPNHFFSTQGDRLPYHRHLLSKGYSCWLAYFLPWKSHSNLSQEGRPSKNSSEGSDRALQPYPSCPDVFIASGFAASFDFNRHHLSCCGDTREPGQCLHALLVLLFVAPTHVPSSLSHPSTAWEMGHTQKLLNKREWGVIIETEVHRW